MCPLPLHVHTPSVSGGFTLMLPEVPCVNALIFLNLWIYVFHQFKLPCSWRLRSQQLPSPVLGLFVLVLLSCFTFLSVFCTCVYLCMNDSSRHVCFKVFVRMVASFSKENFHFLLTDTRGISNSNQSLRLVAPWTTSVM